MQFPDNFLFGAATASYQVEGGFADDGKGPSIWDDFTHTPGNIAHGDTGDVACDHYHCFREDVALMKQLGLQAYRFSIAWARVLPTGQGAVNAKGLAFYDGLVDALLQAGIEPFITLYHWDLPSALQARGGWGNAATADAFAAYAALIAEHFKGRVRHYFTFNEPQITVGLGLASAEHAPGYRLSATECMRATHHIILAHGQAARRMKAIDPQLEIGIASTGFLAYPKERTPKNLEAVRTAMDTLPQADRWFTHAIFCDALVLGRYPQALLASGAVTQQDQAELDAVFLPLDVLGLNIYNGQCLDENGETVAKYAGYPRSSLKWPITPEILYWGPKLMQEKYKIPCYITENGMAQQDCISLDGQVHDAYRTDFTARYLQCLAQAVQEGVDVRGYFHWSLLDNFEWHRGYDERFGLVYVDYRTQQRIIKDSGHWYAGVIASRGGCLPEK